MTQDLLTTKQVAARLGVKAARVRQLVQSGHLKPEPYSSRVHLFQPATVEAYENGPKPKRGRPKKD